MAINWTPGRDTHYDWTKKADVPNPTFAGAVLGTVSRSEQVMSDMWDYCHYAIVWDGERVTEWGIGCGYSGPSATVTVDATPAVLDAAFAFYVARERERLVAVNARRVDEAVGRATELARGKELEVVRGRKVKIGTVGRCFWYGENKWGWSVGLELADGSRVFTAAHNVVVAQPDEWYNEPELMDDATLDREAHNSAAHTMEQFSRKVAA